MGHNIHQNGQMNVNKETYREHSWLFGGRR
jgi:hypothetical protein